MSNGSDRLIHVGIIQYDKGHIASKFERDFLEIVAARCQGSDVLAYSGGACERDEARLCNS